jgi:hypothetical protein
VNVAGSCVLVVGVALAMAGVAAPSVPAPAAAAARASTVSFASAEDALAAVKADQRSFISRGVIVQAVGLVAGDAAGSTKILIELSPNASKTDLQQVIRFYSDRYGGHLFKFGIASSEFKLS